jgi:hypothetical protein
MRLSLSIVGSVALLLSSLQAIETPQILITVNPRNSHP